MNFNAEITLGTMNFGKTDWGISKKDSFDLLDTFVSLGYKKLDTSNFYALGNSEKIIGEWLSSHPRDSIEICTKVGGTDPVDKTVGGLSKKSIIKSIGYSLERLKCDHVDVLYLHYPDFNTNISETIETIDSLLKEGLIKDWGISNYTALELSNLLNECTKLSVPRPNYFELLINLIEVNAMYEIIPLAQNNGLCIYSWSPLCGGLLTKSAIAGGLDNRYKYDNFWNLYKNSPLLFEFYRLSETENMAPEKMALIFLMSNKINPICGFTSKKELLEIHAVFQDLLQSLSNNNNDELIQHINHVHRKKMPYPYNLLSFMNCDRFCR